MGAICVSYLGRKSMNILYLADIRSVHDRKWISYFMDDPTMASYLLQRRLHMAKSGIEIPFEGLKNLGSIPDFSMVRFCQTLVTVRKIRKMIRTNHIDAVHILYAEPNALWCIFRRYFGVPFIISTRGTDVLKTIPEAFRKRDLLNRLVSFFYKKTFRYADWITCTSNSQIDSIKEFSKRDSNISVVRTGIDIKLINHTHEAPTIDGPYILFPRYINPNYNHHFCLEAIETLPLATKQSYKMVFVGKDSGDQQYQKALENQMKKITNVQFLFLPKQTETSLIGLYKHASLVVMTPKSDGSPVSAMEALACGCKVILGPVKYDEELFGKWTFRLNRWSSKDLAELIQTTLTSDYKIDLSEFLPLVDRQNQMKKVKILYATLMKGSHKAD